jgi:hypothetical protein
MQVGITVVGAASLLDDGSGGEPSASAASPAASSALLGMLLVVAAEAVQGAQVVCEDWFMSSGRALDPLTVVG